MTAGPSSLTKERVWPIFQEYLIYDAKESHLAVNFARDNHWLLEDTTICARAIADPDCYNTLKVSGLWDQALVNVPLEDRCDLWLKNKHVLALAYEASEEQLANHVDWGAWELLVEQDGAHHSHSADPDLFYRTRALMALANRLGTDLAPLMCAALHVWLPLQDLDKLTTQWSPLQKAQYAWAYEHSGGSSDTWPAQPAVKRALTESYPDVVNDYKGLVCPQKLANLPILLDLNNGDMNETLVELIQLTKSGMLANNESLDYTVAVDDNSPCGST